MKTLLFTVVMGMGVACASSSETRPPSAKPNSEPASEGASSSSAEIEPDTSTPPASDEPTLVEPAVDEPVVEVPVVEGSWRPPLPTISLEPLEDDERTRSYECLQTHQVLDPEVSLDALMDAATCVRAAGDYGKEISMYRVVIARDPTSPQAMEALRSMGLRFEQMDHRDGALDAFGNYIKLYSKQEDARALGLRAVCLARSLSNDERQRELLQMLERYYGRKGFTRPAPEQLPALCEESTDS